MLHVRAPMRCSDAVRKTVSGNMLCAVHTAYDRCLRRTHIFAILISKGLRKQAAVCFETHKSITVLRSILFTVSVMCNFLFFLSSTSPSVKILICRKRSDSDDILA